MRDRRFRSLRDGIVGITDMITIKMMIVVKDLVATLIEIRIVLISVATLIEIRAVRISVATSTVIKVVPIINGDKLIGNKATGIGVGETIVIRAALTNKTINMDKGLDSVLGAEIPVT
jgi:hypothetical protein